MGASDERDRFIDVVRAGSIVVVVLGHWLMAAVVRRGEELSAANALAAMPWLQPATWLLQVVPLFFVAAGFASSRALSRPGRRSAAFLSQRVLRVVPSPVVMATVAGLALAVATWAGVSSSTLDDVGGVVAQPLWFLAVYLLVALVAPAQLLVHRRTPWAALVALPVLAVVGDVVRLGGGATGPATLNYVAVFAIAQELGFWYADGRLGRGSPGRWLAVAGVAWAVLAAMTAVGPYSVSMIGLPGQVSNMAPPTSCIVVLTVAQVALLMAVRPALERALQRPALWRLVTRANRLALGLFTWHLVALVLAYAVVTAVGGGMPAPGTATWWVQKPVIVLGASTVLAGLVTATMPLERLLAGLRTRPRGVVSAAAVTLVTGGAFATLAAWGLSSPFEVSDSSLLGLRGVPALSLGCAVVGWLVVVAPGYGRTHGSE